MARREVLARALLAGLLSQVPQNAGAATPIKEVRVLTASDPAAQRPILQALRTRFPSLDTDTDPSGFDARHAIAGPIVALGPSALKRALESDLHGPLVSIFSSSQTYRRLLAAGNSRNHGNVTAIYTDASPQAQLQLIAALFERRVTVGVLLSEASGYLEKPLRQAASQVGLELQIERPEPGQDPVRAINSLGGTQVLLAVPDSTLYTPETLRAVLESTYRRGMPVIGFSSATVGAGTLASAYPDLDDVVADLGELLDNLPGQAGGALPEPRYPRYWRVAINDNVARSLGIIITDKARALGVRPSSGRPG
jgi:hypothetical protein